LFMHHRQAECYGEWFSRHDGYAHASSVHRRGTDTRLARSRQGCLRTIRVLNLKGRSFILNSKTKAWIVAGCGIVFSLGLIFWKLRVGHAATIKLSNEDM